ncbi:MAG: DUF2179 domain-containing protein [Lentilactobacillus diolivorans]|jgi:uncharacterized protein YebE (UPF0316 family)|uniref:UPF0316 protein FC85_GL001916 n=2 Tax=Lentilactobacillus diolivorans TaxID=179838 RepID=A0A0R1S6E0_9LACO|nr:DUF2179 domain-containing protein [Lentilactobacillus diolivorans]RRG02519.1 MAG: DUF2179 domain-containing protein [Lactobacillus sp.]KRL62410.1 hypothetical protein FC85_GL001916 [Lentilactobacillus diolivorans DSM 14421]MCH4163917.1 DUF2179 domain-containing protein [Lentilactobacillus diolivorans]MDH5105127.1 DUF2179 domain-containing protein [Lentilactobacillus diolivorans]GEP24985.1 UPF0316 protein [Lentilactobacillus diolivorans]
MQLAITIFVLNALYISINTFRTMLVVKGHQFLAPIVAVFEEFVYVMALAIALQHIDSPLNIAAYAIGFGVGIYIGIVIENKIALGYVNFQVTVQVDPKNPIHAHNEELAENLRNLGYGVTVSKAYGRDGDRLVLSILAPRKADRRLMEQITELSPDAFIMVQEPVQLSGGFWSKEVDTRYHHVNK